MARGGPLNMGTFDRRNVSLARTDGLKLTVQHETNSSENACSSWSTRTIAALSNRMRSHSVMATAVEMRNGCPASQPSPQYA